MNEADRKALRIFKSRVKGRLKELGLEKQMPSDGVFRIMADEMLGALNERLEERAREQEEAGQGWVFSGSSMPVENFEYEVGREQGEPFTIKTMKLDNGHRIVMAKVMPDAMILMGHRFTFEDGKVSNHHEEDGSPCFVPCYGCSEPDIRGAELDGECYVYCQNCQTKTETHADRWLALGAWLIGKVVRR